MSKEQKILLLLVILVGGAGAGFYVSNAKKGEAESVSSTTPAPTTVVPDEKAPLPVAQVPAPTPVSAPTPASTATTFSEDVTYRTPENGSERIQVKLSIKDGLISDVVFTYDKPSKRESAYNLGNFEKALASQGIVGKKIKDVSLSRVGGASLTTAAFNEALSKIAAKA